MRRARNQRSKTEHGTTVQVVWDERVQTSLGWSGSCGWSAVVWAPSQKKVVWDPKPHIRPFEVVQGLV